MLKHLKDIAGVLLFIVLVFAGAFLINSFLFRTFNVIGPSMEPALHTGERLVVNRVPHTWSVLRGKQYQPERGQIIVFKNPLYAGNGVDEYLVKRVIGLPGERVVVSGGKITVYNQNHPDGFNPDKGVDGPKSPTDGDVSVVVPSDEIFVAGDNRINGYSLDSRNGLGTVPLKNIQGPVTLRLLPLNKIRHF